MYTKLPTPAVVGTNFRVKLRIISMPRKAIPTRPHDLNASKIAKKLIQSLQNLLIQFSLSNDQEVHYSQTYICYELPF